MTNETIDYFENLGIAVKKLDDETADAYEAFLKYCWFNGSDRTFGNVAEALKLNAGTVKNWLTKHNWLDRVSVVDGLKFTREFKLREKATEADNQEFAKQNRKLKADGLSAANRMVAVANKLLETAEMVDDVIETGFIETKDGRKMPTHTTIKMKAKISDIPRLVDTAIKTARLVQDLPTEIVDTQISLGADMSNLSVQEIRDLIEQNNTILRRKGVLNKVDTVSETIQ